MPRALVALLLFVLTVPAFAQEKVKEMPSAPSATAQNASQAAADSSKPAAKKSGDEHKFWDKTNTLLFLGVGGARFFDYGSTIWMRHRGVNEWLLTNDIVDNHAAFAAIEVAGTAASIGISYAFHKTGHHKLERAVSIVHIGVATGGAIRNFTLP